MQGSVVSRFRLFLVLLISSVIVVSCGGGGGGSNDLPKTDTTKPTVTITPETIPIGQRVPVTSEITAKFSKSMNAKSVEEGISIVPNNNGTIKYDDSTKTATYKPDPNIGKNLQGDTDYTITIRNSIKDRADNPLSLIDSENNPLAEKTWSFRTEDNVKPKLVTCIPKCDGIKEINISTNLNIYLFFDEAMFKDSFTDSTVTVEAVGSKFRIKGKLTLTEPTKVVWIALTPSEVKPLTDYIVTVTTGVQDNSPAHNPLDAEKIITFKTGKAASDVLSPIVDVSSTTPADGSKNVALNSVISVKFVNSDGSPEVMDFTSINKFNFIVANELNQNVAGTFSNNSLDTVIFTPSTAVGSGKPKNLNILDTYTVTLKSTDIHPIKDKATKRLVANNIVVSTFYTADGVLGSTPTQLGYSTVNYNKILLATKKNGDVHVIWPKNNAAGKKEIIMRNTYQPTIGWDASATDITSKVVAPVLSTIGYTLHYIDALVIDSNDSPMLIWRDVSHAKPWLYVSLIASKWSKATDGTETWAAPEIIHTGSATQVISGSGIVAHRSVNGTVSVAWPEYDFTKTLAPGSGYDFFLVMKQLKSNDGTFGTVWDSTKSRITSTIIPTGADSINESNVSLRSDSTGNIIALYKEIVTQLNPTIFKRRAMVATYPFPAAQSNLFQLDTFDYLVSGLISDSSSDYFVFGWSSSLNRNVNNKLSIFNPSLGSPPSKPYIVSSKNTSRYMPNYYVDVAAFPSGEKLAVSVDVKGINYTKYDPVIAEWKTTQTLVPLTTVGAYGFNIKLYKGARNIVTVAWLENSSIYIKHYKPGFGWQKTQSVTAKSVRNFEITSGLDGKTTITWDSLIVNPQNPPKESNIFAIRLE